MGFSSEADFIHLYSNLTMVIFEEIFDEVLKTLRRINDASNSSSTLELSLSLLLAEYSHTLEYISLGSHFLSVAMKSWTKSIDEGNWTDVGKGTNLKGLEIFTNFVFLGLGWHYV